MSCDSLVVPWLQLMMSLEDVCRILVEYGDVLLFCSRSILLLVLLWWLALSLLSLGLSSLVVVVLLHGDSGDDTSRRWRSLPL